MKKDIHPELKECTITCACGNEFVTKSIKEKISVEICNKCHPFYTGTQANTKRKGNVEKFRSKWNLDKTA